MSIPGNIKNIKQSLPHSVALVAVTKTYTVEKISEAYSAGHKIFGENKVQELLSKYQQIPDDAEWHLIGHLQSNKVKYIAPFVRLIHSIDSLNLLREVNKQAQKCNRIISCLLQMHIAQEETKFGFSYKEAEHLMASDELKSLTHVNISGLMGMATNTEDATLIRTEFKNLKSFFDKLKISFPDLTILSMGMSSDYKIAVEEGSTMIRVGSAIFGSRA